MYAYAMPAPFVADFWSLLLLLRVAVHPAGQSNIQYCHYYSLCKALRTVYTYLSTNKATRIFALCVSQLRQYERSPAVSDGMSTSRKCLNRCT